jgi:Protein of unknown function DUF262/Protein of unknown function (DUF1524)
VPSKGRLSYNLEGIASLLRQHEFRVPTYQRSYAWDASNASEQTLAVDDFWNDLSEALNGNEPDYFLGSLVLTPSDDDKRLTIIDGQQRLATTSLFLAALRDIWAERGEPKQVEDVSKYLATYDRRAREDVPKLILNEEDDPFYRGLIIDGNDPEPTRESHERLSDAYELLKEKLDNDVSAFGRHAEARLLSWLDFLDDQVVVITVEVPTEADAFVIFETLNDRGAALTIGDLLKNYLFMRAGSRLDTVKTSWIAALTALDVSAENETFVMFLRHHWSSMHGATRERDLYASIKANIKSSTQAVAYAAELAEAAKDYAALLSPSDAYWQRHGFTTTTSTNVDILLRLELEQNRPLLLAVMKKFTRAQIRKTLNALVNWSVRGIVVGGIGGGRTEKAYADAAVKVRAGKIENASGLLTELSPIVAGDAAFEDAFRNVRITRPRISRYLLLALERTARGEKEPELVPNRNEDEVNLEHILPRNAKPSDWLAFSPEEVSTWSNRLGNHCLLKKTHNNKIGNKPWSAKKPILTASSLRLTKIAGRKTNWTQKEIAERQRRLAAYAIKTWPRKPR